MQNTPYIYICDHQSSGKGNLRGIISQNATDVYMTCASVFPRIMHTARQTTRAPVLATKIPVCICHGYFVLWSPSKALFQHVPYSKGQKMRKDVGDFPSTKCL